VYAGPLFTAAPIAAIRSCAITPALYSVRGNCGVLLDRSWRRVGYSSSVIVQMENKDLQFQGIDDMQKAIVNLYGRITTMSRQVVNVFEDTMTVDSPAGLFGELIKTSSSYQKSIPLTPGQYRLNVVVRDAFSGNMNNYELALNVPRFY
jgi:hypothetical protein